MPMSQRSVGALVIGTGTREWAATWSRTAVIEEPPPNVVVFVGTLREHFWADQRASVNRIECHPLVDRFMGRLTFDDVDAAGALRRAQGACLSSGRQPATPGFHCY